MSQPPRVAQPLRGVFLDLDGVLYDGERSIAGADAAIRWLDEQRIPHLFLTNTTSRPRTHLLAKLLERGFPARAEQIVTPASASAEWMKRALADDAQRSAPPASEGAGARATTERAAGPPKVALFVPKATVVEFEGLSLVDPVAESGAEFVVVGDLGDAWTFALLNRAFRLLMANPNAQLVALGMTRYWKAENGLRLDVAPFVAALSHATGRSPLVFGKPARSFFESGLAMVGLPAASVAMVGDDIETDIGAAQACGIRGILVRTGKYKDADLGQRVVPDAVIDSIAELPQWWLRHAHR